MKTQYLISRVILYLTAVLFSTVTLSACSSTPRASDSTDEERTFIFNQDGINWQVELKNDKIVELYKNDKSVPPEEISKYEEAIMERIKRYDEDDHHFGSEMSGFHLDMQDFKKEMQEMREELAGRNFHFDFDFDNEQFKQDIQKAASDIKIAFNSDAFKESMEQLKHIKIDVDVSALNEQMKSVREELKNLKLNMRDIKSRARKYKDFMHDLRNELKYDGIINETDEDFDMYFNSSKMEINGNKVPDSLHAKYKKMYEERFGEMKGSISSGIPEE